MSEVRKDSVTVTAEMNLKFPAKDIWPLLCPVREYDWIEDWDCEMVKSDSGVNELGCIFHTGSHAQGDFDTWVANRFEPLERLEFVRMNALRVIRYEILLFSNEEGTRMMWIQHITPLSEEGQVFVKRWTEMYKQNMEQLEKMLDHYLSTGTMLRVS